MQCTSIYVGLNDGVTHEQKYGTERYLSLLRNVCRSYHAAFSVHEEHGGYFHEDGSYVEENTLVLQLMDAPDQTVRDIAGDLCAFFRQESVLVTSAPAEVYFVKEEL